MTSTSKITSVTKNVLSRMTRQDPEEIELEHHLNEDLGLDSMDAVDLVVDLKMDLGVEFGSDDVEAVSTVQDIVTRIQNKLNDSD